MLVLFSRFPLQRSRDGGGVPSKGLDGVSEFSVKISDIQAKFCERISASEGISCHVVNVLSKVTQKQWSVVCSGTKRMKILKAPRLKGHHAEMRNSLCVLERVIEEIDVAEGNKK